MLWHYLSLKLQLKMLRRKRRPAVRTCERTYRIEGLYEGPYGVVNSAWTQSYYWERTSMIKNKRKSISLTDSHICIVKYYVTIKRHFNFCPVWQELMSILIHLNVKCSLSVGDLCLYYLWNVMANLSFFLSFVFFFLTFNIYSLNRDLQMRKLFILLKLFR